MNQTLLLKLVLPLTIITFITTSYSKNYASVIKTPPQPLEQTLNIGDSMPKPTGIPIEPFRDKGVEFRVYVNNKNFPRELEVYKVCNKETMKTPFVIYHYRENTSYVDNKDENGNPLSDGIIDEVVLNAGKKHISDIPECPYTTPLQ